MCPMVRNGTCLNHAQPFSAVMHMVALGVLRIDASAQLSPQSVISLDDRASEEGA